MSDSQETDQSDSELSGIELARSNTTWTQASSAAGYVLRYLDPMRSQLIELLGSEKDADEALKLFLAHLVSAGFGSHKRGSLRNYLLRGVRSVAKARHAKMPTESRPELDVKQLKFDTPSWLQRWRNGLVQRAWRSLERLEHSEPHNPYHSVLYAATANPNDTSQMLAVRIGSEFDVVVKPEQVELLLPKAREVYAQLVADEVAETLETPTPEDVKLELNSLGLSAVFSGIDV